MSTNVYQDIWDADQATNGLPAVRPGESTSEDLGYVVVDERAESVDGDHRVLAEVFIPDSKRETYDLCTALYNNYNIDPGIRDIVTPEESQEERDFIDAIVPLPPLQVAKEAIARELDQTVSDLALAAMIKETWFLEGRAGSKFASGFEHVIVGEQSAAGNKPDDQPAKMGGYHFWHKYHIDDVGGLLGGDDRITYHATKYGGADDPAQGLLVPEVVTLAFSWRAHDFTTGEDQLLTKKIGGFWVGPSPEGMIALGLVRTRTRAPKIAAINGVTYQFDLHRLSDNPRSIRTFFPRFKRSDFGGINPSPTPPPNTGGGDSAVRLVAALLNPEGDDAGRETVTLINTMPEPANLQGWAVAGPNDRRFVFADVVLGAGEARAFRLPASGAQLSNKGGNITLYEASGTVHHQVRYTRNDARSQGFTVVF